MLGEQLQLLVQFYSNPRKAASAVLDRGKTLFAAAAALIVALAIHIPTTSLEYMEISNSIQREVKAPPANQQDMEHYQRVAAQARREAGRRYFAAGFESVMILPVVFVPFCILVLAAWDHLGSGTTILFRDYMPGVAGLLFAWTAANLPIAVIWWTIPIRGPAVLGMQAAGLIGFLILAAPVLSTVTGAALSHSAIASVLGIAASAAGLFLLAGSSNILYMFASPWILFLLYRQFSFDMGELGGGLSSRQNFKRQLEIATLNPRDADAHYQLGLLSVQRRLPAEAEQSFRRALAIDPNEPDVLFHLGRLLRNQGQLDEARQLLERGAKLNPKLSSSEVWRELGALELAAGAHGLALTHLQKYTAIREYDPEGLVLLGQTLRVLGRPDEARAAFEQAIESARAAPKFRRGEVARWESQARQELRSR